MKKVTYGKIVEAGRLAEDVYMLEILVPDMDTPKPGQFVSVFSRDDSHLLPRPISICDADEKNKTIKLVYRVCGYGTRELSGLVPGDDIRVMGPLGNGFPIDKNKDNNKNIILVGGGIGIPPVFYLAKYLKLERNKDLLGDIKIYAVLGYRDSHTFLLSDLKEYADQVVISTDDGSIGTKGTVVDAIIQDDITGDVIYACGPLPMLRGIKSFSEKSGVRAYLSMEERMACGVGACLGCVCKTTEADDHSKVKNARVCADGPVFDSLAIDLG